MRWNSAEGVYWRGWWGSAAAAGGGGGNDVSCCCCCCFCCYPFSCLSLLLQCRCNFCNKCKRASREQQAVSIYRWEIYRTLLDCRRPPSLIKTTLLTPAIAVRVAAASEATIRGAATAATTATAAADGYMCNVKVPTTCDTLRRSSRHCHRRIMLHSPGAEH